MSELKTLKDMNLLFKDRLDLQKEFQKWAKKNNVLEVPMSVIGWFVSRHNERIRQEAIKWIKERIKNCVYACRHEMVCKEHKFWMDRFNITEEDLK